MNFLCPSGCGSVLNEYGNVEMDAMVMDGRTLDNGAVSAIRGIANATRLARLVMEKVLSTDYIPITMHCITLHFIALHPITFIQPMFSMSYLADAFIQTDSADWTRQGPLLPPWTMWG